MGRKCIADAAASLEIPVGKEVVRTCAGNRQDVMEDRREKMTLFTCTAESSAQNVHLGHQAAGKEERQTFCDMIKDLKTHRDLGYQSRRDSQGMLLHWAEVHFWDVSRFLGCLLYYLHAKSKETSKAGTGTQVLVSQFDIFFPPFFFCFLMC